MLVGYTRCDDPVKGFIASIATLYSSTIETTRVTVNA